MALSGALAFRRQNHGSGYSGVAAGLLEMGRYRCFCRMAMVGGLAAVRGCIGLVAGVRRTGLDQSRSPRARAAARQEPPRRAHRGHGHAAQRSIESAGCRQIKPVPKIGSRQGPQLLRPPSRSLGTRGLSGAHSNLSSTAPKLALAALWANFASTPRV